MNEIKIHLEDTKAFFDRAKTVARQLDEGTGLLSEAHLSFDSIELLLKVLTPNRWAALTMLKSTGPSSIRALGIALGRDYKAVHSDVAALVDAGLMMRDASARISVPWRRLSAEMELAAA